MVKYLFKWPFYKIVLKLYSINKHFFEHFLSYFEGVHYEKNFTNHLFFILIHFYQAQSPIIQTIIDQTNIRLTNLFC